MLKQLEKKIDVRNMPSDQEHLFISYATEDSVFAEWLSLRLTSEGYKVWCDRFKLLGGESYPKDIDEAIKQKTFRVLGLLSYNSIKKDNPVKERTLALSIGKERGIGFLIPLNIDGLSSTELDWMTNDLTYIPFYKGWASGYSKLLKKLESINAPKDVRNGKEIATQIYLDHITINNTPEKIYSNHLQFEQIPNEIIEYHIANPLTRNEINILADRWAFWYRDSTSVYSFVDPPDQEIFKWKEFRRYEWLATDSIGGIPSVNIVKNLLKRSLYVKMIQHKLARSELGRIYFPFSLFENEKFHFTGYTGRKTYILVAGERHYPKEFKYHISPSFNIKQLENDFFAELSINLYLTDISGEKLESRSMHSRHKQIRNGWWNNHYLNRCLAVCEYLSDENKKIIIGDEKRKIVLNGELISFQVPNGIDETKLKGLQDDEKDDEIEIGDDLVD